MSGGVIGDFLPLKSFFASRSRSEWSGWKKSILVLSMSTHSAPYFSVSWSLIRFRGVIQGLEEVRKRLRSQRCSRRKGAWHLGNFRPFAQGIWSIEPQRGKVPALANLPRSEKRLAFFFHIVHILLMSLGAASACKRPGPNLLMPLPKVLGKINLLRKSGRIGAYPKWPACSPCSPRTGFLSCRFTTSRCSKL